MPSWQFELLLWGMSSRFPLVNHFDLTSSQSIIGMSQDPTMRTHTSLSQDGFSAKAVGRTSLDITLF